MSLHEFNADEICNFGRMPMNASSNPLNDTAKMIVREIEYGVLGASYKNYPIYKYHVGRDKPTLGDVHGIESLNNFPFSAKFEPWVHEHPLEQWIHDPDEIFSHDYVGPRDLDFYTMDSVQRISGLVESIKENGYKPDDYDSYISIDILYDSHARSRIYIADGHHRVAALIALKKPLAGRIRSSKVGVQGWASVLADDPVLTDVQAEIILNRYMDV